MKSLFIVSIILVYVFTSAFLESGPDGRVTVADLMLVGIMLFAGLSISARNTLIFPQIYSAAVPMFLVFLVGSVFAVYPGRAAFEFVVILFGFFGGIAIVNLLFDLPEVWIRRMLKGYVITIGLISLLCVLDFFVMPGLVSSRQLGGLQGPFRNTGQAGSFFGVHAALILAMIISHLVPRSPAFLLSAALVLLALAFTLKRASILAVVAGIIFLMLFMAFSGSARDKKISVFFLVGTAMVGTLGYVLFDWALEYVPGLRWRLEYKFSVASFESFEDGFFAENIASAFSAFGDRPLIGVGLDNVRGVYQSHEIHSTYLGILAYSGLVGVLTYGYFMIVLFYSIYRKSLHKLNNAWSGFLYYLLPLLMGQMIGWGYTTHTRKREFWILMIFVAVALSRSVRKGSVGDELAINNRVEQ